MIEFLAGSIFGAAAILLLAIHLARKAKQPEVKPQHNGIAAVSMDLSGTKQTVDATYARMLNRALEKIGEETRH